MCVGVADTVEGMPPQASWGLRGFHLAMDTPTRFAGGNRPHEEGLVLAGPAGLSPLVCITVVGMQGLMGTQAGTSTAVR